VKIEEITLDEILDAREKRAIAQRNLIAKYNKSIVSLSMNIAGEIKMSPLIDLAFSEALENIEQTIKMSLLYKKLIKEKTGPEALYVFDCEAEALKEKAIEIETANPIGRLFDIDVITVSGEKLSRNLGRTCLVCGGPVTLCSRSRAHGLDAVKHATQTLLLNFASEKLADFAVHALVCEAELSPKPGLVDLLNNGSHKDMNLDMLRRSAGVLRPYFVDCVRFGAAEDDCIEALQNAGISAENIMLKETGGINTHKGAIFALGIYLGALGGFLVRGGDIFARCKQLVYRKSLIDIKRASTHGTIVKEKYKSGGAMEEALLGFPTARKGADALRESGDDSLYALLKIMEDISDTNLLYRGGSDALNYVQQQSSAILNLPLGKRKNALLLMDKECINRNISPGGAADMLSLAFLIDKTTFEI
jgi:holo-ACP synthase/triphosphoribosyl-dephospho-CoA synthase